MRPNRLVISIALIAGVAFSAIDSFASAPRNEQVLADNVGRISEIMLQFDNEIEEDLAPTYDSLFNSLPTDIRLVVVCSSMESGNAFEHRWGEAERNKGRDISLISVERPITVWARDRRLARVDAQTGQPGASITPLPLTFYDDFRRNDLFVPVALETMSEAKPVECTSVHIEGGNIVSNSRHVFVGANVFDENKLELELDKLDVSRELLRIFGRPFVVVGDDDGEVPWDHIDMYLTPIDNATVLLASPALAEDLLLLDSRSLGAFASLTNFEVPFPSEDSAESNFDGIADQLEDYGYNIVRLPAIINDDDAWMITYNNVLMEIRDGEKVVYMPTYGIPALDNRAESTYRSLGFIVERVDVSKIFLLGGTVRCLANVTARNTDPVMPIAMTPAPVLAGLTPTIADDAPPHWSWNLIIWPIAIFFLRVADVSIGTVRLICISRGIKTAAIILGFFEVLIWVTAVATVLTNLADWPRLIAYCAGFAAGSGIGMWIEQKIAFGTVTLTLISRHSGNAVATGLRTANYAMTKIPGEGRDGPVDICMMVMPRNRMKHAVNVARGIDPDIVVMIEDIRHTTIAPHSQTPKRPSALKRPKPRLAS